MCPYFTAGKQRLCLLCDVQSSLERVLNMSVTLHCCLVALLHFGLKESTMYICASNPHHQSECGHDSPHVSVKITKIGDWSTAEMLSASGSFGAKSNSGPE